MRHLVMHGQYTRGDSRQHGTNVVGQPDSVHESKKERPKLVGEASHPVKNTIFIEFAFTTSKHLVVAHFKNLVTTSGGWPRVRISKKRRFSKTLYRILLHGRQNGRSLLGKR